MPLKHVVRDDNASLSPRKQNFIENFIAIGTIKVSTDKVISKKIYIDIHGNNKLRIDKKFQSSSHNVVNK
jgi:hypothetical protein